MAAKNIGRRDAIGLGAVGVAAVAVGLTGCAPVNSSSTSGSSTSSSNSSSTGTSSSASGSGTKVAALAEVPVGAIMSTKLSGKPVVVTHVSADSVACFSAICPHQGCTVAGKGNQIVCPCHGSTFDPANGAALTGPTNKPLTAVPVKVAGADIVTS